MCRLGDFVPKRAPSGFVPWRPASELAAQASPLAELAGLAALVETAALAGIVVCFAVERRVVRGE